jgi:hypothetical protein
MRRQIKTIISVVLVGIICLSGISTVFLNIEYWKITTADPANYISEVDLLSTNHHSRYPKGSRLPFEEFEGRS